MSPAGFWTNYSTVWSVSVDGGIGNLNVANAHRFRSVLNLKSDTQISDGDGTKENPFVVE